MSFNFNSKEFETVETKNKKTVMKKDRSVTWEDFLEKTRRETFSYKILKALNTTQGQKLVVEAEEALRVEKYMWLHRFDDSLEPARENIYKRFRELDEFLKRETD